MALNAIKTTSGYVVEGTDAVGVDVELFFSAEETRNYDRLVSVEENYLKTEQYKKGLAKLPDPERDLYLTIFGSDEEPQDETLHTTLVEPQEARNGISLDWTRDSVTAVLRLIAKGESDRIRLIAGRLVDMGKPVAAPKNKAKKSTKKAAPKKAAAESTPVRGDQAPPL